MKEKEQERDDEADIIKGLEFTFWWMPRHLLRGGSVALEIRYCILPYLKSISGDSKLARLQYKYLKVLP